MGKFQMGVDGTQVSIEDDRVKISVNHGEDEVEMSLFDFKAIVFWGRWIVEGKL